MEMKRAVLKAACQWGLALAAIVLLLDVMKAIRSEQSMFGFHPIHFVWLMVLGEWIEPLIRKLPSLWHGIPIAKICFETLGLMFFGILGALMGGLSKLAALAVESKRHSLAH